MNKIIKKEFNKIISIFILLQPVLDLITGICLHEFNFNLTLGIIIRMLFLFFVIYSSLFIYKKKNLFIYYLAFTIYSLCYLISLGNSNLFFGEIQGLLRVFYFPLLLISFYELKDEIRISKKTLFMTLSLYLIFIFIPILLNSGFKSYQITKSGTLGYYNSANEISGIISILTPIIFIIFNDKSNPLFKTIYTILYLIVIVTIGTKTPLLSLLITVGMTFIWIIVKSIQDKKYKRVLQAFALIVGICFCLIVIIPKTNFYKNIKVHLDYLEIKDVTDVIDNGNLIDHFIFSQRVTFFTDRKYAYNNSSISNKLFGIGYYDQENKQAKLIEMDYLDIYFNHGIIGFIVFFSSYIYVLFKTTSRKNKLDFNLYMLNTSMLLILFLSLFTGHIITAPSVSIIVISLIMILINYGKKEYILNLYKRRREVK